MMNKIHLIWIIPISAIFGCFVGLSFMNANFNITMDNNTRIAVESLADSLNDVSKIEEYSNLIMCKDLLLNTTIEKMECIKYHLSFFISLFH